jgi:hypothetical protein
MDWEESTLAVPAQEPTQEPTPLLEPSLTPEPTVPVPHHLETSTLSEVSRSLRWRSVFKAVILSGHCSTECACWAQNLHPSSVEKWVRVVLVPATERLEDRRYFFWRAIQELNVSITKTRLLRFGICFSKTRGVHAVGETFSPYSLLAACVCGFLQRIGVPCLRW